MKGDKKSNEDYIKQDTYSKIKKLLELDLDQEEKTLEKREVLERENGLENEHSLYEVIESFDGCCEVTMDAMKMYLYLDLKAPINSDTEITIMDIKVKVEEFGPYCESCVDWDRVNDIYTRVMFDGELLSHSVIAEGKPVKFHIPEHFVVKESLLESKLSIDEENGSVNYHHINPFITVSKDEYLGDIVPENPGTNGINLIGDEIKSPVKHINFYTLGKNIKKERGKLYSTIDGSFKIKMNELIVAEVLEINTDVDYSTGDINFKGDVAIDKTIRESFEVVAGGDITVKESIEPTNISCGNNLTVQHGLIGNEDHNIYIKNDLIAKHAENVNVECLGSVHIANGIINSNISSIGTINIGKKASIIGGVYRAQNGIIAGNIGNPKGKQSNIYLGMDFTVQNKIIKNQKVVIEIMDLINKLQLQLAKSKDRKERDEIKLLYLKAKSRLNSLNNYSRSLLYRLDKNESSTLTVYGKIKPRTYIEICHISYIVDKEVSGVKFSLDKKNGCIKQEFI